MTSDKIVKDGNLRFILGMIESGQELTTIKEWVMKNYCKNSQDNQ